MPIKYRRIKELSLHDRQLGVTSLERLKRKRMMKLAYLAARSSRFTDWETYFRANKVLKHALREYMLLASALAIERPLLLRKNIGIDNFPESSILSFFRFRTREQLHRLKTILQIADVIQLSNRASVSGVMGSVK
jgi:hypothetical protein